MKLDRPILIAAVVGSLAFANIIGVSAFGRLDLTKDGQFTLGEATRKVLRNLHDPITVKAYFTADLPAPFSSNARYVQDLLEEYYAHADGNFRYEFISPEAEESAEEKEKKKDVQVDIFGRTVRQPTDMERELQGLGIPPVQVQVREQDKLETRRAYMGLVIHFRDKKEVIPVVQDTGGLEYDVTSLMQKLTRDKTPKLALLRGEGSVDPQQGMGKLHGLLSQVYELLAVNVAAGEIIPEDVDAALVLGPKIPFGENALRAIDAFIARGKSVAFLLDAVKPEVQTLQAEDADHGLTAMLASYGVKIGRGLVLDAQCATINIQQQRGWMRISQPVQYPFFPVARNIDQTNALTRGITELAFPFASPVTVELPPNSTLTGEVLIRSSEKSWTLEAPFNLDPMQRWTEDKVGSLAKQGLMASLKGSFPSYFPDAGAAGSPESRMLVMGTSAFLSDQFSSPQHQALLLNMVDWLVLDEGLLAMRSRGLGAGPIDEVSEGTKSMVKYANILGLPFIFVVFGVARWRTRESRRSKIVI